MRYALIFFITLLTGCSSMNRLEPANDKAHLSSCFNYSVCNTAVIVEKNKAGLKISVQDLYHPIQSATLWMDGARYPLIAVETETKYRRTNEGLRISSRLFKLGSSFTEKLEHAYRVQLLVGLQSYTIETSLKRPGDTAPLW